MVTYQLPDTHGYIKEGENIFVRTCGNKILNLSLWFAFTACPNTGETVQNGACVCANTGETVQNGVCTCVNTGEIVQNGACVCTYTGQTVQNGVCACPPSHVVQNGTCTGKSHWFDHGLHY